MPPPALDPDVVLVGKAPGGGYVPVAAMVTAREIHDGAVGSLERSKEVRGRGLMLGFERRPPSSRVARLSWRLMEMASEGSSHSSS